MPQEFITVSASSYDSAALATKLTEKSAEGWDVVGIVNTSTEVTAFLSRAAGSGPAVSTPSSSATTDPASGSTPSYAASSSTGSASTSSSTEPSGWGTAPASTTTASSPSSYASSTTASADPSSGYSTQSAATPAAAAPAAAAASSTPSVPAGWYADPAGRFDLRYWDGSTWTEHVSRAGQQFTDPPVA